MSKRRIIKNTVMIGLIAIFAGASVFTMKFVGEIKAPPSLSASGIISQNSQNAPNSDNNNQLAQTPQNNRDSQNGSGFVPDDQGNLSNQNGSRSDKDTNDTKPDDKSSNNSDKNSDNNNSENNQNAPSDNNQNTPPDNNSNQNGQNNQSPNNQNGQDNRAGQGNQNGQNNQGGFQPDNQNGNGGFKQDKSCDNNVVLSVIKYGAVCADSLIIASLVMYLVISRFNKRGFKESFSDTHRILIFVIGTIIIAVSFAGAQIAITEFAVRALGGMPHSPMMNGGFPGMGQNPMN